MLQFTQSGLMRGIRLGQQIGRGGEGAVFVVEGQEERAAKIYSSPPDRRKAKKLAAMSEAANRDLLKIAAWPDVLLRDNEGAVRGFTMPRVIARRDIHELYSPKGRLEAFPAADFRFLVHVAANVARAFAVVHEQGHVLADVNHGNLLVGKDGIVTFIDCDSFQIGQRPNDLYTCDVGVPLFTAPELQGRAFRGLVRNVNHDRFGLAVLLFHLLFMGRHPFAGQYSGVGEMPIEKAISEFRFAYGPDNAANGMMPPPGTVPFETMGSSIAQLFTRAFGRTGSNGVRPDAKTWVEALDKLKSGLRICSAANWHHYPAGLISCPWCTVESRTGVVLFRQQFVPRRAVRSIDLTGLWNAISSVPDPGSAPPLPSERPWRLPPGVAIPVRKPTIVSKAFQAIFRPRAVAKARAIANKAYTVARTEWEEALARWERGATRDAFAEKIEALQKMHAELTNLSNERRQRLANQQLLRYLGRFRIDRANIPGVGASRSIMLASYGIETAADIRRSKIMQVPSFGVVLTAKLIKWRQRHERNFRFDPSAPLDRRDGDAIDRKLGPRRRYLYSTLRGGPADLLRLSQEIKAARLRLMPAVEKAWNDLKIAEARRDAL